jgi:hypothetical protein
MNINKHRKMDEHMDGWMNGEVTDLIGVRIGMNSLTKKLDK